MPAFTFRLVDRMHVETKSELIEEANCLDNRVYFF